MIRLMRCGRKGQGMNLFQELKVLLKPYLDEELSLYVTDAEDVFDIWVDPNGQVSEDCTGIYEGEEIDMVKVLRSALDKLQNDTERGRNLNNAITADRPSTFSIKSARNHAGSEEEYQSYLEKVKALGLSSPWSIYCKEVRAFFQSDPGVRVVTSDDETEIRLYVDGAEKAEGLDHIIRHEKGFGNVAVKVSVYPSNRTDNLEQHIRAAMSGNKAVRSIQVMDGPVMQGAIYTVFRPEVVQYITDDISDVDGKTSTLMQHIAKDIFEEHAGVYWNTEWVD